MLPLTKLANGKRENNIYMTISPNQFLPVPTGIDPSGLTSWPAFFLAFLKQGLTHYVAPWLS